MANKPECAMVKETNRTKMNKLTTFLKTKIALLVAICAIAWSVAGGVPALAASNCPSGQQEVSIPIDQGGTKCVPINKTSAALEDNPIFFYLKNILYFLAGGVGLAVVGGIVTGSYLYITARADAGQTKKGQMIILNSVIGLLLFIFMYAILQFLIPGGVFS